MVKKRVLDIFKDMFTKCLQKDKHITFSDVYVLAFCNILLKDVRKLFGFSLTYCELEDTFNKALYEVNHGSI